MGVHAYKNTKWCPTQRNVIKVWGFLWKWGSGVSIFPVNWKPPASSTMRFYREWSILKSRPVYIHSICLTKVGLQKAIGFIAHFFGYMSALTTISCYTIFPILDSFSSTAYSSSTCVTWHAQGLYIPYDCGIMLHGTSSTEPLYCNCDILTFDWLNCYFSVSVFECLVLLYIMEVVIFVERVVQCKSNSAVYSLWSE